VPAVRAPWSFARQRRAPECGASMSGRFNSLDCSPESHGGALDTPQLPRREMTARAAKLAAAGAAAFSLVQPVLAASKARKVKDVIATDRDMQEVTGTAFLAKHPVPGARELVVGLDGEPYWLITEVREYTLTLKDHMLALTGNTRNLLGGPRGQE
jgi:hypothetical protein